MIYTATFPTLLGPCSLPLSHHDVRAGFARQGLSEQAAARALINLQRGLAVVVGGCVLQRQNPGRTPCRASH